MPTIKVQKKEFLADPVRAGFLLRWMCAANALRSALKWHRSVGNEDDLLGQCDKWISFITVAGWLYESLDVIHKATKCGILTDELLDKTNLYGDWTHLQSREVKKLRDQFLRRIRNKCAFHFSKDATTEYLKDIGAGAGTIELVHTTKHSPGDTVYIQGLGVIVRWLQGLDGGQNAHSDSPSEAGTEKLRLRVAQVNETAIRACRVLGAATIHAFPREVLEKTE
jgi:hypothetical protein